MAFFDIFSRNPFLFCVAVALGAVIFINGWTDAPTAIVTCVSSGALSLRRAAFLAAVCNLAGIGVSTALFPAVAATVRGSVRLPETGGLIPRVLFWAMVATAIWAVAAWAMGLPTSESHGLLAGLSGAAVAFGGWRCMEGSAWLRVLLGLLLSVGGGMIIGFFARLSARWIWRPSGGADGSRGAKGALCLGAAAMAFMHGAQDGQKFIGLWMLALSMPHAEGREMALPVAVCAILMGAGTLVGGGRIVRTLGERLIQTDLRDGVAADIGAALCLLALTVLGLPVSTTHTKTAVLMGVGMTKGQRGTDVPTALRLVTAWLLTFPVCFLIAYLGMRSTM